MSGRAAPGCVRFQTRGSPHQSPDPLTLRPRVILRTRIVGSLSRRGFASAAAAAAAARSQQRQPSQPWKPQSDASKSPRVTNKKCCALAFPKIPLASCRATGARSCMCARLLSVTQWLRSSPSSAPCAACPETVRCVCVCVEECV